MIIDFSDETVLRAIEYSVMSKIKEDSDERCTIIAHPDLIQNIKIAIAEQKIFRNVYSRLIFQPSPDAKETDLIIIPDSLLEKAVEEQMADTFNNDIVKAKAGKLNKLLETVPEELLVKLADENAELTEEEKKQKEEIQCLMIELGQPIDNAMSKMDFTDKVLEKVAKELGGNNG